MKPTHKIAHLVPTSMPVDHPLAGPVQKRAQELAIAQARRGHEVEIYSVGDSGGEYTCQGVKYRIGSCRLPGCLRDLGYLIATARELRRQQPDVIHVHDLIQGAAMLSSVPAPKVLTFDDAHFHQGRTSPRYHLTRCALAMYSCVLPASRHTHDTLARHWNLPAHLRAAVVCNGVNRQQFRPQPEMSLRQQWGFDHTACVALACLSSSESSDLVVDAFELARRRHPDLKLVVATTGNQATDMLATDPRDRVRDAGGLFLGPVPERELAAVYNSCDFVVLPGCGPLNSAMEAQSCGKPVISSDRGRIPEIIAPASSRTFQHRNRQELAREMLLLASDIDWRGHLSRQAVLNSQRLSWDYIAGQLEGIYEGLTRPMDHPDPVALQQAA